MNIYIRYFKDDFCKSYLRITIGDPKENKILLNEIQAYLSTGIGDNMTRIKDIKQAQIPFKETFDSYAGKIKPKKIQIDWSTDLND